MLRSSSTNRKARTLGALRAPLSAAFGLLSVLAAGDALAGSPYRAVWYPDGVVRWWNTSAENAQDSGEARGQNIIDAMDYMSEHSPLDIAMAGSEGAANLRFTGSGILADGAGMTDGYWNETLADSNKNIAFGTGGTVSTGTVLHEFGHALGFPHEFQRSDRDSFVDVCFNVDPWNYSKQGSAYWPDPYYILSPYDYASIMNSGYSSCVTPLTGIPQQTRTYDGISNVISVHDINSVYRMYAARNGTNEDGDRFGHAVATGDYDDDGIQDIAVAKSDVNGDGTTTVTIMFYRGVQTDSSESGPGTRYVPWFNHAIDTVSLANPNTSLATGDFNGDGIDDLAVGQPWYNSHKGRVQILFLNSGMSDANQPTPKRAPWGRKGVRSTYTINPSDVGLASVAGKFGFALAAGKLTASKSGSTPYDDLLIGAPAYSYGAHSGGLVTIVQGRDQATVASFSMTASTVVYNPGTSGDEFGKAVTVIPGYCNASASTADLYNDTFLTGAPGYSSDTGKVYLYGCATNTSHTLLSPSVLNTVTGVQTGARYGQAVAGFRRRMFSSSTTYRYYAAIGAPSYTGSTPNPKSGIVYVDEYAMGSGTKNSIADFRPSTRSDNDEFGASLAVQQTAVSSTIREGGKEVYLGIGMPGTQVSGYAAGKVYMWRVWNSDGTLNTTANVVSASNPTSLTDTRLGDAIATLRNLDSNGGFVAGAPTSREPDNTNSGSVKVILNSASSSYSWSTWSTDIDEETDGDHRPTN
jgi:hypothetical protein